ncbi:hypothetical protein EV359DRAFT_87582, partial [Lentinula novae-zelandiae]
STASTPLDRSVDSRGRVHHFYHLVRLYRLWIVRWSPPLLPPCLPLDHSVDSRGEVHHLHYLSSASPASVLCGRLTSSLVTNQISLSLPKFWIEIRHYDTQDNEQLPRSQVTKATRRNGTKKSVVMLSPKRRQHAPDPNKPLSPAYRSSTQDPSPPAASGVRRHVSLTYAGTLQTAYPNRSTSTFTHGYNGAPTASSPSLSSSSSPSPVQDIESSPSFNTGAGGNFPYDHISHLQLGSTSANAPYLPLADIPMTQSPVSEMPPPMTIELSGPGGRTVSSCTSHLHLQHLHIQPQHHQHPSHPGSPFQSPPLSASHSGSSASGSGSGGYFPLVPVDSNERHHPSHHHHHQQQSTSVPNSPFEATYQNGNGGMNGYVHAYPQQLQRVPNQGYSSSRAWAAQGTVPSAGAPVVPLCCLAAGGPTSPLGRSSPWGSTSSGSCGGFARWSPPPPLPPRPPLSPPPPPPPLDHSVDSRGGVHCFSLPPLHRAVPALNFPSSEADMDEDGNQGAAPANNLHLFLTMAAVTSFVMLLVFIFYYRT